MKALYNFYNKLFGKQIITSENIDRIKLIFYITQDNQIKLKLEWSDSSESSSDILASLLYCLNSGFLSGKIIDTLNESATNNQKLIFIKSVLSKWDELCIIQNNIINEPVVKPLGTFNANPK